MSKQFLLITILLFSLCFSSKAQTQDSISQPERKEILFIKNLTSVEKNKGKVQIHQDPRLLVLMEEKAAENIDLNNQEYITLNGYRVQLYSNNTPKKSKLEAFKIEAAVKEKHPEMGTYVTFTSPFWKVRVGDCTSYQEAFNLVELLKSEFPEIRNDIYIVKENIRVPIK